MIVKNPLIAGLLGAVGGAAIASIAMFFIYSAPPPEPPPDAPSSPSKEDKQPTKIEDVNAPSGTFKYGTSTTWAPIRGEVDPEIEKAHPQFLLEYSQDPDRPPGSETGIDMLLKGQLAIAQSSRPVKDEEYEKAAKQGFRLKQVPVAIDIIAIAVNPKLEISGLTLDQIKGIYTGEISNWNQVGGPNLSIKPYSRPAASGTTEFFVENVLQGKSLSGLVEMIDTTTQAVREVGKHKGGIYFASASEVVNQCSVKSLPISSHSGSELVAPYRGEARSYEECLKDRYQLNYNILQTGQYPLTRRLFVVIKQNGQIEEEAGNAYADMLLTNEGQILIKKAGFIPLRF